MWEKVRPGRREGAGWRRRNRHAREGPDSQGCGSQGTRGAHLEHAAHGSDLGRVEAERLVERRRELPSRKAGMRRGKRCGPGGARALGGGDATGVHGEGPTQVQAPEGTRGAHVEHHDHVRDAGGVPIGNVRVEIPQVIEEVAHVGDIIYHSTSTV